MQITRTECNRARGGARPEELRTGAWEADQMMPWATIARATFRKPAMLAPTT